MHAPELILARGMWYSDRPGLNHMLFLRAGGEPIPGKVCELGGSEVPSPEETGMPHKRKGNGLWQSKQLATVLHNSSAVQFLCVFLFLETNIASNASMVMG